MKILILKPSSLGDIVQALPVLRLLKQHLPHSAIYWWVESANASLLENDPDLAGIIRFERKRWAAPYRWPELWKSIQWMRQQHFDWVIDLQSLARSGAFAWLANGSLTIGLDDTREGARGFYDRVVRRPSFNTHAVDWYLQVLPALGLPAAQRVGPANRSTRAGQANFGDRFVWLPERPAIAAQIRQKWPAASEPLVVIQPGARWMNKRWPAEHFADVVSKLSQLRPGLQFVILGAASDQECAKVILASNRNRCLDLTGQTTLPEMVEWIRISQLMITNDTGPMHVAAALGRPLIALFGPTEPTRTGPYGQIHNVLQLDLPCVPCLRQRCNYFLPLHCLRAISPAAVLDAARLFIEHVS